MFYCTHNKNASFCAYKLHVRTRAIKVFNVLLKISDRTFYRFVEFQIGIFALNDTKRKPEFYYTTLTMFNFITVINAILFFFLHY